MTQKKGVKYLSISIYTNDFFYRKILNDSTKKYIKEIGEEDTTYYKNYLILSNGKERNINAVKKNTALYFLQKELLEKFLNKISLPDEVNGFVKGKSYKSYLRPHIKEPNEKRYYLRLDIKSYFESITEGLIKEILSDYIKISNREDNDAIISDIVNIVTLDGTLPQGAVTSPAISNLVFRRLDLRIIKYCRKVNVTYSRYADDMLFSSSDKILLTNKIINLVKAVFRDYNFELNSKKTIRTENCISLNGFVVAEGISLSRKKLSVLKKVLFLYDHVKGVNSNVEIHRKINKLGRNSGIYFSNLENLQNYLSGYRSFLISWLPEENSDWRKNCLRTIERIETCLIKIN